MRSWSRLVVIGTAIVFLAPLHTQAAAVGFVTSVNLWDNAQALDVADATGEAAHHALLRVSSSASSPEIILVTLHAPPGVSLASTQLPVQDGWVMTWTRTSAQFVGSHLGSAPMDFRVGLVSPVASGAPFVVDVQTKDPTQAAFGLTARLAPLELATQQFACQVLVATTLGGSTTFLPFGTLSDVSSSLVTSSKALVAVYDLTVGTYVNPAAFTGTVLVTTATGFTPASGPIPLEGAVALPIIDAVPGPVTNGFGAGALGKAAVLWQDEASAAFFVAHPGPVFLFAEASIGGVPACSSDFSLAGMASPLLASHAAPAPFTILPPQLDSDGDGYTNAAELKANSLPVSPLSTPYTDDDCDGIANGRDAVSIPVLGCAPL